MTCELCGAYLVACRCGPLDRMAHAELRRKPVSESTDWKARAELLQARFVEETTRLGKELQETHQQASTYLGRALEAEKKLASLRSNVGTFLEGLEGLRSASL